MTDVESLPHIIAWDRHDMDDLGVDYTNNNDDAPRLEIEKKVVESGQLTRL